MIEMEERGPAITDADLERVEKNLGLRFPDVYRAFLLEINGGQPSAINSVFPIRKGGSILHVLYGIHEEQDTDDLEHEVLAGRSERLRIPETLIPIGMDAGGEILCLGVAGEDVGRVYFRERERVPDEPPRHPWTQMKGYVRIANSFAEFLASLMPRDED